MSDNILISAEHIYRYYGGRCALEDISFSARSGEVTGFLGPNGAGKSTLMQILCGVLAASSGRVCIAGHDILDSPLKAKSSLGYLPEQPPLYQDCSVDEYLSYCARLKGVTKDRVADRVKDSKQKCRLHDAGSRIIASLSKGYQQRIGLAQAIIHDPDVLILDEPGSGLDPRQIVEMRDLISDIGKDHCVIFSTHILAEAQGICDRILILNNGRIILDKPLSEMQDNNGKQSIMVNFTTPPKSLDSLNMIDGVLDVIKTDTGRYRIFGADSAALATLVAEAATANHWGLKELNIESLSLEQIYIQLTRELQDDVVGRKSDH